MSANEEIRIEELLGTWQLISVQRAIVETGEITDLSPSGNPPFGILMYGNDGRMLVLNITSGRPKPDSLESITDEQRGQLFRTMPAYGGTYTVNGQSVSHHIDISWNECWTGTTQVRTVTREGERLVYTTSPAPGALDGRMGTSRLVWERAANQ
jgi:hypothetical protein